MNGLLNMGPRTAQSFWNHSNANSLSENAPPRVFESSKSAIGYSQGTGAAQNVVLQARSLLVRSVQSVREINAEQFKELLRSDHALPDDTLYVIEDSLHLSGDDHLTDFAGNLFVKGYLVLENCAQLTDISGNIIVGGNFSCLSSPGLSDISGKIKAGGNIRFFDCHSLASLSGNIASEGTLSVVQCSHLRSLSGIITPGAHLQFWGCSQLSALPDWITSLGTTSSGATRYVCLAENGLSEALLDHLHSARVPGMFFSIITDTSGPGPRQQRFDNFQMAFAFWQKLATTDVATPTLTMLAYQERNLITFLEKLTKTADYQNTVTRPVLAQRIIHTLVSVLGNEQIQDEALAVIHFAISSCHDRVTLALDDLETLKLNDAALTTAIEQNDPTGLIALGTKIKRLEEVKCIARQHAAISQQIDEVEVELAFQIAIREHLELPGSAQHLYNRACAQITQEDIREALDQLQSNSGEEQVQEFLEIWQPWQIYRRHMTIPPFATLRQHTVADIEACPIDLEVNDEMVMLNNTHMTYKALCKAYELTGNNPLTNTPLDWRTVVRLSQVSADHSAQ